ncbi:hypothetical protein Mgra_00009972 [Meloidogyne graminicola]|uniref:Uncharacterized protein n=1 Tax=Meloidogyne graminicola TaxID=189291 RepID=A0A8S9ZAV2_9BILA|nr:hypothetical protein Mgra_00009972 [Meloidogyne graminicola]
MKKYLKMKIELLMLLYSFLVVNGMDLVKLFFIFFIKLSIIFTILGSTFTFICFDFTDLFY